MLYNHTYGAYDVSGFVGNLVIYSAFSVEKYFNPMLDYYYAGRVKTIENSMWTQNMSVLYFDVTNMNIPIPEENNIT